MSDDEPLELVPEEEDEAPTRPVLPGEDEPADAPVPGAPPLRSEEPVRTPRMVAIREREEAAPEPPEFRAGAIAEILAWPFRGEAGRNLVTGAAIYVLALVAGGVLGFILSYFPLLGPFLGAIARVLFALGGFLFLLEFGYHLTVATLRGRLSVQQIFVGQAPRDGLRMLLLWVLYFLPATIVGLGTGSALAGAAVAIAAWILFPAAFLLAAATGLLSEGNPVTAARLVTRAGKPWIAVTIAFVPLLLVRVLVGAGVLRILIEAIAGVLVVYVLLLAALLARGNREMMALLEELTPE